MAVPSNSALFECIGGDFGYSHTVPLTCSFVTAFVYYIGQPKSFLNILYKEI